MESGSIISFWELEDENERAGNYNASGLDIQMQLWRTSTKRLRVCWPVSMMNYTKGKCSVLHRYNVRKHMCLMYTYVWTNKSARVYGNAFLIWDSDLRCHKTSVSVWSYVRFKLLSLVVNEYRARVSFFSESLRCTQDGDIDNSLWLTAQSNFNFFFFEKLKIGLFSNKGSNFGQNRNYVFSY